MSFLFLDTIAPHVAGRWVPRGEGEPLQVTDPATGETLADVPTLSAGQVTTAIEAAEASLADEPSLIVRRGWVLAVRDALLANREAIATIITRENGKPLKESRVEVDYSAGFFGYFATQLDRLHPDPRPGHLKGLHWSVRHRPAGVAGLVTPWNFPLAMLAKKLAAAMAAGCAIVAKPAEQTPLTAIALWQLMDAARLPMRRFNLVIGNPAEIGRLLCDHPAVRLISFTGSTAVGQKLIARSAAGVKRLSLELGGNAPLIVLDDADLPTAADALMVNKFRSAGQTCVCANRVLVYRSVAERFTAMVAERVARLRVGNGMADGTDIGPLINRAGYEKAARHVADALAGGARPVVGGSVPAIDRDWGCFFPPTVLSGVTPAMLVSREETFGPVVAITTIDDDAHAIELANGTPAGLAAYVFTADAARAERIAARLHFGHVGLNTASGPTPEAPFGGMKQSGFGREGGVEGLLEFCDVQTVVRS